MAHAQRLLKALGMGQVHELVTKYNLTLLGAKPLKMQIAISDVPLP